MLGNAKSVEVGKSLVLQNYLLSLFNFKPLKIHFS